MGDVVGHYAALFASSSLRSRSTSVRLKNRAPRIPVPSAAGVSFPARTQRLIIDLSRSRIAAAWAESMRFVLVGMAQVLGIAQRLASTELHWCCSLWANSQFRA